MNQFVSNQKILIISLIIVVVDFIAKALIYTRYTLGQGIDVIDGWLGIYHVETLGFGFSFYFRTLSLLFFLYILIRIIQSKTTGIFKMSTSLLCFGLIGDFLDTLLFGYMWGYSDFKLSSSFNGEITFKYIEYLYINLGITRPTNSLSSLMANIGLIIFIGATIFRFKDLKEIMKSKK
ncbi:MAG: hypothetical protein EBR30_15745 [Cytophagia bacterium]|nr:hypothetical protein [Cytophagia bacterium]